MSILAVVEQALRIAEAAPDVGKTSGTVRHARSQMFVSSLGDILRRVFADVAGVRVLNRSYGGNKKTFGLNEVLYDVLVCEIGNVPAARSGQTLTFVKRSLWMIESEFAKSSRAALYDFNKLVLGNSANKLFVAPRVADNASWLATLRPAAVEAVRDGSRLYCAQISHPREWKTQVSVVEFHRFVDGAWQHDIGKEPLTQSEVPSRGLR